MISIDEPHEKEEERRQRKNAMRGKERRRRRSGQNRVTNWTAGERRK